MEHSADFAGGVSPIRRATAEFNVGRWLDGKCPQRERPSYEDLLIAGYSVVRTEDLASVHERHSEVVTGAKAEQ